MWDMFNRYPYINLTDRNLDLLTKAIREMQNEVKNFVSINAVKYANPIQWSINRQYEKNTIVIDPLTGTAFISVQPVPSGVALTRTQYWTPVFNLSQFVTKAASNFANSYERDITTTATVPTGAGDWVVWDSTLYVALTSIHAGDAYVINGNIKRMTVEDFYDLLMETIRALDDRIDDEIENRQDADTALAGRIDDEIGDRQDADTALGGRIDDEIRDRQDADTALNNRIGILSNLNTTAKNNVVEAINEVLERKFIFKTKSDLINSTAPIENGDIIYIAECDASYIIESSNTPISLPANNKYAKLLPDVEGFYNISALTTSTNQDVLPFITYLINNGHSFFKFGRGEYKLSDTITLAGINTPQVKFVGAGKFDTIINCTKGFIDVTIDGYNFRGSEFIGFTASGVQTGVVGGNYHGFNFTSATNTANDMFDNVKFSDMLIKYFDVGVRVVVRSIWNLWTDCEFLYNNLGFAFSKTSLDSFFNCNTFINCRFSTNKARAVTIYAKSGQAVSNNFVGCSIEGSYYTNEESAGNLVELDLYNVGVLLTGCHFEKANTLANATAICAVNSNVLLNECYFYNYVNHTYTNSGSMIVFNSPSLYGGTSLTAYGTDTGTTIKNNPYTFV